MMVVGGNSQSRTRREGSRNAHVSHNNNRIVVRDGNHQRCGTLPDRMGVGDSVVPLSLTSHNKRRSTKTHITKYISIIPKHSSSRFRANMYGKKKTPTKKVPPKTPPPRHQDAFDNLVDGLLLEVETKYKEECMSKGRVGAMCRVCKKWAFYPKRTRKGPVCIQCHDKGHK